MPRRRCATSSSTAPASSSPNGGGAGAEHLAIDDEALSVAAAGASDALIRVNDALKALEAVDPELAGLVEMRYFGGYSEVELAELLGVNERTVRRRWDKARAWLYVSLGEPGG